MKKLLLLTALSLVITSSTFAGSKKHHKHKHHKHQNGKGSEVRKSPL